MLKDMVDITKTMAEFGGICPVCKKRFKPNGVGGKGDPLTPILQKLPTSSVLKIGANYHDWAYHLGPNWGTREDADRLMLEHNRLAIAKFCEWWQKPFYHLANYRNYYAVRKFGNKFWNRDDCNQPISMRVQK